MDLDARQHFSRLYAITLFKLCILVVLWIKVYLIMADLFTCSARHLSMLISAPFVTRLELSAQRHRVCAQFSDCLIIWISSSFALYL
jgi:hypothetical protein